MRYIKQSNWTMRQNSERKSENNRLFDSNLEQHFLNRFKGRKVAEEEEEEKKVEEDNFRFCLLFSNFVSPLLLTYLYSLFLEARRSIWVDIWKTFLLMLNYILHFLVLL